MRQLHLDPSLPDDLCRVASLSQHIFDIPLDFVCLLQALLGFGVKATFHSPSFAVCRTCSSASAMLCQQTKLAPGALDWIRRCR